MLGGNLGNPSLSLNLALQQIKELIGPIVKLSPIYETEPWGTNAPLFFLNQVVEIETEFEPRVVLNTLLSIETHLGRIRNSDKNGPRIIDLDILYFEQLVLNSEALQIPHPRMHLRKFVMQPLYEFWPSWIHPVLGISNEEIYKTLNDPLGVKRIKNGL